MYIQQQNFGGSGSLKNTRHSGIYEASPRIHQFSEIVFVEKGEIEITVDNTCETATAGDLAVITPFRLHSLHTPVYAEIRILRFSHDFVSDFLTGEGLSKRGVRSVFRPRAALLEYVRDSLPEVREEYVRLTPDSAEYRAFKALAYAVFSDYTKEIPQQDGGEYGNALQKLLLYLNEHYREESLTLASCAAALGYNAGHISHCLKALPDMNFRTCLNALRVDHAKELLKSTDLRIIDIALESGYSCERSFHRAFLRLTGKTPREYRAD